MGCTGESEIKLGLFSIVLPVEALSTHTGGRTDKWCLGKLGLCKQKTESRLLSSDTEQST